MTTANKNTHSSYVDYQVCGVSSTKEASEAESYHLRPAIPEEKGKHNKARTSDAQKLGL
jgi:hypothetical protein